MKRRGVPLVLNASCPRSSARLRLAVAPKSRTVFPKVGLRSKSRLRRRRVRILMDKAKISRACTVNALFARVWLAYMYAQIIEKLSQHSLIPWLCGVCIRSHYMRWRDMRWGIPLHHAGDGMQRLLSLRRLCARLPSRELKGWPAPASSSTQNEPPSADGPRASTSADGPQDAPRQESSHWRNCSGNQGQVPWEIRQEVRTYSDASDALIGNKNIYYW